jgi:sulfur relay (sulfurtransferase) DsrF/TusC family protein
LQRSDAQPTIFLEFGPTAVVENQRVPEPIDEPDYSRVFVTIYDVERDNIARIVQTEVSLLEVIRGLAQDDGRLRDAVLAIGT